MKLLKAIWTEVLRPMVQRPMPLQVAALCLRGRGPAQEVLLVTSRGTGRWVVPKGWPIRGLDGAGSALQEAWEEAGVRGRTTGGPLGRYVYDKRGRTGLVTRIEVLVYPIEVDSLADDFPEAGQRQRRWVLPQEAAAMVAEPDLRTLLGDLPVVAAPSSRIEAGATSA